MTTMEGPTHLLSLKVMRLSRPDLAAAWQPFYSSSPSFSAHSTSSILSLQGKKPIDGHPKTLRDFTHATELLNLPSSFGSIQLGETFTSCLCVNNESHIEISGVALKVEMQTATTKVVLAEFGGPEYKLAAGDTLENVVDHEIKELGQHVLACSVTYHSPPNTRVSPEDSTGITVQNFRKFYKFAVTNPLSVKTKVHIPRSPSAIYDLSQRDVVFLEVHIQNLTTQPICFEKMLFEGSTEWTVGDANVLESTTEAKDISIFSGSMTLMQPQDTRQFIYILTPKYPSLHPPELLPGSIIPLGRLDISWRSLFGEPARLLTSTLSRRILLPPAPLPQQPASALPPYLKRVPPGPQPGPRPHSPQIGGSRPSTPPPTLPAAVPNSPYRIRSGSLGPARPQSPPPPLITSAPTSEVDVKLIVRSIPRDAIQVEKPFTISFTLLVSAPIPRTKDTERRVVTLIVQHVQYPNKTLSTAPANASAALVTTSTALVVSKSQESGVFSPPEAFSPRLPSSGFSTPSTITNPTFNYALAHQKLLVASPRQSSVELDNGALAPTTAVRDATNITKLPPPVPLSTLSGGGGGVSTTRPGQGPSADEVKAAKLQGVAFVGPSTITLPSLVLQERPSGEQQKESPITPMTPPMTATTPMTPADAIKKTEGALDFELGFVALERGLVCVGGLRVLLVNERVVDDVTVLTVEEDVVNDHFKRPAQILREWDVIAEIWVPS